MRYLALVALVLVAAPTLAAEEVLSDAVVRLLDPQATGLARTEPELCRTAILRDAMARTAELHPQAQALVAAQSFRPAPLGGTSSAGPSVWVHGEGSARVAPRVEAVLKSLPDVGRPVDVYLTAPAGALGSVVWDAAGEPVGVALAPDMAEPLMRRELVHQLTHLAQLRRWPADAPAGWFEGVAVYRSCVSAEAPGQALAEAVAPGLARREAHRDAPSPSLLRSRASLAAFLCEASGGPASTWGLEILDAQLQSGASWDAAFGRALASLGLGTPAAFHVQHALWLALVSGWDNGRYFSFGGLVPEPGHVALPDGSARQVELESGGHHVAALDPVPRDGGYWVTVRPTAGAGDVRGAVVLRGSGSDLRIVPIPRLHDGTLRIGVPVRAASGALVVVANGGTGVAQLAVASEHDPVFPFALSSFTTEPTSDGVLVRWTVAEERGLVGWRVMRSRDPARGFSPVTRLPLPARGMAQEALTYVFLDRSVRPGERYFYFLEGASAEGLVQPSFVVSVTTERR